MTAPKSKAKKAAKETSAGPRKAIRQIKPQHLTCRALRQHSWQYTTVEERNRGRILIQGLHCPRCNAVDKFQEIDGKTGFILKTYSHYDPESGYLIKDMGRVDQVDQGYIRLLALGVEI